MKKLHYLSHVPFEGPAHIINWARCRQYEISNSAVYKDDGYPLVDGIDLLVIMGGPMSVNDTKLFSWLAPEKDFVYNCIHADVPVLGICLGAQMIADVLGAPVYPGQVKEIGWFDVIRRDEAGESLFGHSLPERFTAFHWHGETFDIPAGAVPLAKTESCYNQAFSYNNDRVLALQFHCESTEESIKDLVENCADEMDNSSHVMDEKAIKKGMENIPSMHRVADGLLDIITR